MVEIIRTENLKQSIKTISEFLENLFDFNHLCDDLVLALRVKVDQTVDLVYLSMYFKKVKRADGRGSKENSFLQLIFGKRPFQFEIIDG